MGFIQRTGGVAAIAVAVLWPGAALALGDGVKIQCGQQTDSWLHLAFIVGGVAGAITGLTLLAWGAHWLWQRQTGRYGSFSLSLAAVIVTGLLLVASGIMLTPASSSVYASFGMDLSTPVQALMDYPFLLSIPLIAFPFLLIRVEGDPHRERYFAAFIALEFALLCAAQWVLNIPIVIAC
jgi:hypothetical protein